MTGAATQTAMDRKRARELRIAWLVLNEKLWEGFPQSKGRLSESAFLGKYRAIVIKMKEIGLIAKTTYFGDYNLAEDINKAREKIRASK